MVFVKLTLDKFLDKLGTTVISLDLRKDCHVTCIFSLKQTIDYYKSRASPVYICYLDASKAFDRINHWALAIKLIDWNVPTIAIRLLCTWYTTQQFCVQWGLSLSSCLYVSDDVLVFGYYLSVTPFWLSFHK